MAAALPTIDEAIPVLIVSADIRRNKLRTVMSDRKIREITDLPLSGLVLCLNVT